MRGETNLQDMKFCDKVWPDNLNGRARLDGRGISEGLYWILSEQIRWDETVCFHLTREQDNESYSYMKYEFIAIFL